jgi:putative DNA primase/helicase
LSYDESSKPVFTLEKHKPEQLNIYICDYEYKLEADDSDLNGFLDNVLDKVDQEIILRLIASCLDIKTARKHAGRGLKAVINYGDGANGKDTLREIFTQLIGKHRFTSISLQSFKEADSGRRFGIFDLYRSAINWSSENSAINTDKSQTLKAAITGDPIQLERKNKDPIEASPRAIFFFNMNGTPNISSLSEAVKSRLCPIEFKNTFKTNPNSSISTEKKADPRFKEDPEFIRKTILPALLNRIIEAFSKLLDEGIDYNSKEKHFEDIARSNNHLLEFIGESSLVECSLDQGLSVGEIYESYIQWCLSSGLANDKSGISKASFISETDRFISNAAEMSKRLGECFLGIKRGRVKLDGRCVRVIGVRVNALQ